MQLNVAHIIYEYYMEHQVLCVLRHVARAEQADVLVSLERLAARPLHDTDATPNEGAERRLLRRDGERDRDRQTETEADRHTHRERGGGGGGG